MFIDVELLFCLYRSFIQFATESEELDEGFLKEKVEDRLLSPQLRNSLEITEPIADLGPPDESLEDLVPIILSDLSIRSIIADIGIE